MERKAKAEKTSWNSEGSRKFESGNKLAGREEKEGNNGSY